MSINPLKLWRMKNKMRQEDLARILLISRQTLNYIENNKVKPSTETLLSILIYTRIEPIEFYKHYHNLRLHNNKLSNTFDN